MDSAAWPLPSSLRTLAVVVKVVLVVAGTGAPALALWLGRRRPAGTTSRRRLIGLVLLGALPPLVVVVGVLVQAFTVPPGYVVEPAGAATLAMLLVGVLWIPAGLVAVARYARRPLGGVPGRRPRAVLAVCGALGALGGAGVLGYVLAFGIGLGQSDAPTEVIDTHLRNAFGAAVLGGGVTAVVVGLVTLLVPRTPDDPDDPDDLRDGIVRMLAGGSAGWAPSLALLLIASVLPVS